MNKVLVVMYCYVAELKELFEYYAIMNYVSAPLLHINT